MTRLNRRDGYMCVRDGRNIKIFCENDDGVSMQMGNGVGMSVPDMRNPVIEY